MYVFFGGNVFIVTVVFLITGEIGKLPQKLSCLHLLMQEFAQSEL